MERDQVRAAIESMSYRCLEGNKSIFGLSYWGNSEKEAAWIQPRFQQAFVERFLASKIKGFDKRIREILIDLLIEFGYFHEAKTVEQVTLAINVILSFTNLSAFRRAYRTLQQEAS